MAFWGLWKWIGFNFLLLLVGTIQIFLSPPDEDPASGWVHGLHGLLALFVLVIAAVIVHRDMRLLGLMRPARGRAGLAGRKSSRTPRRRVRRSARARDESRLQSSGRVGGASAAARGRPAISSASS